MSGEPRTYRETVAVAFRFICAKTKGSGHHFRWWNLLGGLAFVLLIELFAHKLYEREWFPQTARSAMDAMIVRHEGFVRDQTVYRKPVPAFTFIDADNATWSAWDNPDRFPHDKLQALIEYAARAKAKAIVVDVDTSVPAEARAFDQLPEDEKRVVRDYARDQPTGSPVRTMIDQVEGDHAFAEYLKRYAEIPKGPDEPPPLILAKRFVPVDGTFRALKLAVPEPATAETSPAADTPEIGKRVYAAAPLFNNGRDMIIREWRLLEPNCSENGGPAIPSVQLLLLGLLQGHEVTTRLFEQLKTVPKLVCAGKQAPDKTTISVGRVDIELKPREIESRIIYTTGPDRGRSAHTLVHEQDAPLIRQVSAISLLNRLHTQYGVAPDLANGRIVIIGASAWAARDEHGTPVGSMPGAWILINAIASLTQFGQLHAPKFLSSLLSGCFIGLVVWFILEIFELSIALPLSVLCIALLSVVFSWVFLKAGYWVDAAVPSLGILVHRWCLTCRKLVERIGQRGPRFVFSDGFLGDEHRPKARSWLAFGFRRQGDRISEAIIARAAESGEASEKSDAHTQTTLKAGTFISRSSIVIACILACGHANAEPRTVAGRVIDMDGVPEKYEVTRADGPAPPVAYYMDLLVGDRVQAFGRYTLTVELPSDPKRVVRAGEPLEVPPPTSPVTVISETVHEMLQWISFEKPDEEPTATMVIVRGLGQPLVIPVLKSQRFVATGTRRLPVGWSGGKPPFAVTLRGPDGAIAARQTDVQGSRKMLPPVALTPGNWTLEIADADGHVVTGKIAAVDPSRVPSLKDPSLASMPPEAAHTASAAWLASQANGSWAMEAATQAAASSEGFEPAKVLMEELLRGRVPMSG